MLYVPKYKHLDRAGMMNHDLQMYQLYNHKLINCIINIHCSNSIINNCYLHTQYIVLYFTSRGIVITVVIVV